MRFNVSELAKNVCYAAALCAVSMTANASLSLEKQREVYEQAQNLLDKNDINGYLVIRPKIADYPFTTLHPNLGVVGIDGAEFVVADIPGLIEGASEGRGLGDLFLGHVERCAVLLHLVDGSSGSLLEDYKTICSELEAYGEGLADKPRVTVLNKIDTLDAEERAFLKDELEAIGAQNVLLMSGASGEGVTEVLRTLRPHVDARRAADRAPVDTDEEEGSWHP